MKAGPVQLFEPGRTRPGHVAQPDHQGRHVRGHELARVGKRCPGQLPPDVRRPAGWAWDTGLLRRRAGRARRAAQNRARPRGAARPGPAGGSRARRGRGHLGPDRPRWAGRAAARHRRPAAGRLVRVQPAGHPVSRDDRRRYRPGHRRLRRGRPNVVDAASTRSSHWATATCSARSSARIQPTHRRLDRQQGEGITVSARGRACGACRCRRPDCRHGEVRDDRRGRGRSMARREPADRAGGWRPTAPSMPSSSPPAAR